jgi:hypothetical protein
MSNDIVELPRDVVDPTTGELISRDDVPAVVRFYQRIGELQRQFKNPRAWANQVLLDFLDSQAKWTVECAGFKVSAPSPDAADVEWDLAELAKLKALLPADRYAELVKTTVSYEPQTGALHSAKKAGGEVARIIERAERRTPKRFRYASVKSL